MEIIVPAAGLSSRFPNMRPKYLLADFKKKLMIESATKPYLNKYNVTIGVLKEHEEKYNATKHLKSYLGDSINIVVIDGLTKGPADTVYQIIKRANINENSPILIKDCDSFFNHDITFDNYVCVSKISEHEILKKLYSKSFTISNDQNIINNIIEKKVVSDTFCVGGYAFRSAKLFCDSFEKIHVDKEIFVSHIIQHCIQEGEIFTEKNVSEYIDVGTSDDWFSYNDRPVFFCDIDGTIVKAQAHGDWHIEPMIIEKNVQKLLEYYKKGSQFIFTTARPEIARKDTEKMLKNLGFEKFECIFGLQNARRIIINDYNHANPFPRAEAINIFRDSDNLEDFL
jgi:hypothetical protein